MTWKISDDKDFVESVEQKREAMNKHFWERCKDEREFAATGAAMIEEVAAFISFTLQSHREELGPFFEMFRSRIRAFWAEHEKETLQ